MEYPGAIFTHRLRQATLALFVAAFFVVTPLVVLYTIGYRYDWKNGLLRETGSISIDILPTSAKAYLNGQAVDASLPIRLPQITPGVYDLLLRAPGYADFEERITVSNKDTTYIKEISLLKKNPPEPIVKGTITALSLAPGGRYLAYQRETKNGSDVMLEDLAGPTATFAAALPNRAAAIYAWSAKGDYLLVESVSGGKQTVTVVPAADPVGRAALPTTENLPITRLEWSDTDPATLFYSTPAAINAYLADIGRTTVIGANNYADWFMENNSLWTIARSTSTQSIVVTRDALGFSSALAAVPDPDPASVSSTWKILRAHQNTVLLRRGQDADATLVRSNKQFTVNTEQFAISPYNNWWLFYTPWELWTYSEGDQPRLLSRFTDPLRRVTPLDRFNTLALVENSRTAALFPYYYVEQTLIDKPVLDAQADSVNKILYYIDKEGLWKLSY